MDNLDRASFRDWQAQQGIDDDEAEIDKPSQDLDPLTVTALLMLICCPSEGGLVLWKTALRRLVVLCSIVIPDIGKRSYQDLADELTKAGIQTTRASLSSINNQIFDATGIRRSDKVAGARESYRQRACKVWSKKASRSKSKE